MSRAENPNIVDIQQDGPDQTWDLRALSPFNQSVDKYRDLGTFPEVYNLLRFQKSVDHGKQEAAFLDNLPQSDQLPIDNIFGFYNNGDGAYQQVAFGVGIGGQSVPVPFQSNDRVYDLPITYQQKDSSNSFFSFPPQGIPFPDSGLYFEEERKRINEVDAWGTLKTPYGTFETIRVKTVIKREDSVSIQGVSQGIDPPDQVLFKWLAKDAGNPILQVQAQRVAGELVISGARYQDSNRSINPPTGLPDADKSGSGQLKLYPNPAQDQLYVKHEGQNVSEYRIFNQQGKLLKTGELPTERSIRKPLAISSLKSGIYFLQLIKTSGQPMEEKLFIKR